VRLVTTRNQQVARIDYERDSEVDGAVEASLARKVDELGATADALLISDYLKGVISRGVAAAAAALAARRAGRPVRLDAIGTIADGIALKAVGERTFPLLEKYVDDLVTVEEEEIAEAILVLMEKAKLIVEGAGAVPLAALLAGRVPAADGPVVLVVSGGNIDVTLLARIIERGLIRAGRLMRFTVDLPDRPGRLAHISALVGQAGGNILHVFHDRGSLDLPIAWTRIRMDVETRGDEHATDIARRITEAGYAIRRLG
jgi:threonine dehydratase